MTILCVKRYESKPWQTYPKSANLFSLLLLGHGYLIFRYAFPPTVAKWTRTEKKMAIFILFYIAPRLCNISGTNGPTEMVHLSTFAEFDQGINGNIFSIAFLLLIITNLRIITCKCTPLKDTLYENWSNRIFQPLRPLSAWNPEFGTWC